MTRSNTIPTTTIDQMLSLISTPDEYDALLESFCLDDAVTEIAGIPRKARFEDLSKTEIQLLDTWFGEHGTIVELRIATEQFALHLLGADEIDPAKTAYNYVRGKGKDAKHYWCKRNTHNRKEAASNLGIIEKEGLTFDLANGYFVRGPIGQIDAWSLVSNLQHRCKAALKVFDETGVFPSFAVITEVAYPPQLNAVNDRGKPKDGKDQEFIDDTQVQQAFCAAVLEEHTGEPYLPEDFTKYRDQLAKVLVTTRNNVYSRFQGTGYHPSKRAQPSTREALAMQRCFETLTFALTDDEGNETGETVSGDALQALLVLTQDSSRSDDGKKLLWADHVTPAMASALCVLACNSEQDEAWNPGDTIVLDFEKCNTVLNALASSSDKGSEGYSAYLREIATVKSQAKKPAGMDKWVFWGLVAATSDILANGQLDDETKYFPAVTKKLQDQIKKGNVHAPIFKGYDCGSRTEQETATESED